MKISIKHELADSVSIVGSNDEGSGLRIYANEDSVEIAFFKQGNWVTELIPEFTEYAEAPFDGEYSTYGWVPKNEVLSFLLRFSVNP